MQVMSAPTCGLAPLRARLVRGVASRPAGASASLLRPQLRSAAGLASLSAAPRHRALRSSTGASPCAAPAARPVSYGRWQRFNPMALTLLAQPLRPLRPRTPSSL
jgi:hypothetical protein